MLCMADQHLQMRHTAACAACSCSLAFYHPVCTVVQAATAGKLFKTEVLRGATVSPETGTASGGTVVGAAWSTGSGGEVAAEVNHPGGE
jgi:hypothetical protein